ncbi:hypothetical protein [Streptomyces sp. NPDC056190]|uniref:hypothetical protein n=1 Tax=Streptomyces sp. NPDC056190 TaxID=3345741 RepID=UPI0035DC2D0C
MAPAATAPPPTTALPPDAPPVAISAIFAARVAGGHFTWTLIHREALQSLALDSYADFLRRSEEQQRKAAQFYRAVRDAARREVPQLPAGHTTALQAATVLADRLAAGHQAPTTTRWGVEPQPLCQQHAGRNVVPERAAPGQRPAIPRRVIPNADGAFGNADRASKIDL